MKLQNFHKSILGILLTLGVLAALLVPAVPASAAATADWPLQLVGVNSLYITQTQFEAMASAHPSTVITETSGPTQYRGVALWRLVALVDDADPSTLNSTLASSISIQGYSTPAYNSTALTSAQWYGTSGSNEENVIVANQQSIDGGTTWVPLQAGRYPLKITGTVGGTIMTGSNRPSQLSEIQLVGLPNNTVSISPASQTVANSGTFTVDLCVNTNTASRGWQATVNFDATKLQVNSVTEGGFLANWTAAKVQGGNAGMGTISSGAVTLDNTNGHVIIPGYAITGTTNLSGPSGAGVLCTISFTANASVNSLTSITPSSVVVSDINGTAIAGFSVTAGQVTVGTPPSPTAAEITAYSLPGEVGSAVINSGAGTIAVTVPNGTNVNSMIATFAASANRTSIKVGSTDQVSGVTANNFTSPVVYRVTAQDGSTFKDWTVTVTIQPASTNSGSSTVNGTLATASISISVPTSIQLGTFKAGWNVANWASQGPVGTVTVTPGTSGVTSWIVNAQGAAYMMSGGIQLTDPLLIGVTNSPWSCADGTSSGSVNGTSYNGMYTATGANASGSFNLWAAQYIASSDITGGAYSDTITFTATCAP